MKTYLIGILCLLGITGVEGQVVLQALESGGLDLIGDAYILSVYDDHYYPWEETDQPQGYGSTEQNYVPAGSTGADPMMNYQGKLGPIGSSDEKKIAIPYVCEKEECNYGSVEVLTTISQEYISNSTEDKTIRLLLESGSVPEGEGHIIARIGTVEDEVLNFVQLDLNKGLGTDKKGVLIAEFRNERDYKEKVEVDLHLIPGILDRYFHKKTNEYAGGTEDNPEARADWAADEYEHQFAYLPVSIYGEIGSVYEGQKSTWLNNNLGAEYADIHSPYFHPARQAKVTGVGRVESDIRALGSLFQWQRKADGHELYKYNETTNKYSAKYEKPIVIFCYFPEMLDEYIIESRERYREKTQFTEVIFDSTEITTLEQFEDKVKSVIINTFDKNIQEMGYNAGTNVPIIIFYLGGRIFGGLFGVGGTLQAGMLIPDEPWYINGKTNPCPQGYHVPRPAFSSNYSGEVYLEIGEGSIDSFRKEVAKSLALPNLNNLYDLLEPNFGSPYFLHFGIYGTSGPASSGYGPDGNGHIFILSRHDRPEVSSSYSIDVPEVMPIRCIKD